MTVTALACPEPPDPTISRRTVPALACPEPPDAQSHRGGGEPSETTDQFGCDVQGVAVGGLDSPPAEPNTGSHPIGCAARLGDAILLVYADALDDIERTRTATENRIRALRQTKGLEGSREEARLATVAAGLKAIEHQVELDLRRAMRAHPLGPWVKAQHGVGDKQAARLLAAIGDPYIAPERLDPHRPGEVIPEGPRTVSQLWALCGYHVLPAQNPSDPHCRSGGEDHFDPGQPHFDSHPLPAGVAARRRKGQKANWNSTAKTRAYLVAESCMKQMDSPYRAIYDARRAHTAETHPEWPPGHSHNDGLRITAKAILKDLWIESRRLHDVAVGE